MTFDEQLQNFQDKIVADINSAGLPLSVVELVLGNVLNTVTQTKQANIEKAKEQAGKQTDPGPTQDKSEG